MREHGGFRKTESTATAAGSEAADTAAASEAVNKTGYPIMNEDYTFKIVYPVASTDKIGGWENKDFVKNRRGNRPENSVDGNT